MAKITSSIPSGTSIHNNLSGLNDGDYIHLTQIEKNKFDNLPNIFVENHSDLFLDDGTNPHGTTKSDVGLNNVDNTNDLNKPISTLTQNALDLKANIANPTFTGNVVLPSTTSIGTVDSSEIGYLNGVTSSIQTQIDTINISQITIVTTVSIDTSTTVSGISQKGRNVVISNGANAINYTINASDGFVASYVKHGSSSITFIQGSGRTMIQVDGTAILNGTVGSRAAISSVGTTDYLYITNY